MCTSARARLWAALIVQVLAVPCAALGQEAPRPPATRLPDSVVLTPPLSGPTTYRLTLVGTVARRPGGGGPDRADSVVLVPEVWPGVQHRLDPPGWRPFSYVVGAGGRFGGTLEFSVPNPCLRLAAVRRGRQGRTMEVCAGPLAGHDPNRPPPPEDRVRVRVPAPAR